MKTPAPPPCPFEKLHPSELQRDDAYFMQLAYNQAIDAWRADEVPVGAIVARDSEVIARAHNQVVTTGDPTAHAETIALSQAAAAIGDWRLNDAVLFATKEPCPMCSGAAVMARIGRVVYGVPDPKMGCLGGAANLNTLPHSNHRFPVTGGVLLEECRALLQAYFAAKRTTPIA